MTELDYDLMGRVKNHRQFIGNQQYDLEYGYNLAGQMTSEKYPSGKVVTNSFDANGRLSGLADASRTYLSGLAYAGTGGSVSSMTMGNGIAESFQFNDRGQMKQMAWTKDAVVIGRYDYSFGQLNSSGTVDTTKNNGQLAQVESYIGGTSSSPTKQFTQKFNYDSIGRLDKETEYRGDNNTQVYSQKFSFDRFGNRYLKAADNPSNQNPLLPTPVEDNNIDRTTNRLASNTNTVYDEAGNTKTDTKYRSLKYFYDANGRMIQTSTTSDTNTAIAAFDAAGNKVATKVNDIWRFMIYDAFGKLVSEYGGLNSSDEGGVKFIHQDIQGSTRCVTSVSGAVISRMDYQAFGEQLPQNIGQRTASGFSSNDSLRQRYALTERDEATGLDDTWFRKHENRSGRWTSPDPYNGSMSLGNPQSLNRFAYVENQPTNFVDPTGLLVEGEICQINGQVDGGGNPVYQGTVVNGRCQSHAGSSVQSFGWLFSLLFGLGGNPQVNFGQMQNDFPSIGPPTGGVPNKPEGPCMGIGISFSGTAIVGTGGNVAGGTGGWFLGHKPDDGQTFFGSSGSAVLGGSGQPGGVGYPSRQAGGFGGYLDAGPSLLLTRGSSDQLGGTTTTHMFGSPLLSIQMGMNADQKTWQTLEIGPPAIGFGYFKIQTQASKPIVANTPLRARLPFLCGGK